MAENSSALRQSKRKILRGIVIYDVIHFMFSEDVVPVAEPIVRSRWIFGIKRLHEVDSIFAVIPTYLSLCAPTSVS